MAGLLCPRSWGSGRECWDSGCDSAQRSGGGANGFVGYHFVYRYIEGIQNRTEQNREEEGEEEKSQQGEILSPFCGGGKLGKCWGSG